MDADQSIAVAARTIREGGLVAFPTETVYGLGADALNARAAARIFEAKGRPYFDPLIVHVADLDAAREVVTELPEIALRLAERFWPGPLTLVVPKRSVVPDIVTAGLSTVAIRIPAHPVAQALLRAAGCPIAAPSANRFGRTSPTTAEHVREQLEDRVDLILDGGACRVGIESTVLSLAELRPVLLRHGGAPMEALAEVVGEIAEGKPTSEEGAQPSPGMLTQHYAPQTRLRLVDRWEAVEGKPKSGVLAYRSFPRSAEFGAFEVLSSSGDLAEAAANLFAAMRRLDASGVDEILAELLPEQGLGRAINDRLRRAASD